MASSVAVRFLLEGLDTALTQLEAFRRGLGGIGQESQQNTSPRLTNLRQNLTNTGAAFNSASERMQLFGQRATGVGRSMSISLTLPIVGVATALVNLGMEAVESENLFSVAMGDMSDKATDFSQTLRRELGLNEYEVRKQIATFFNMTNSMGLSKDAAYEVSAGLTQLTYDMSSLYNLAPHEIFEKLQAGITGEMEPLKRLGIIVNDTTTAHTAMTYGLIRQGEQMDEAQKVMARYLTILDQTTTSQGDLARTLDSPTNKLRLMWQEFRQISTELGMSLLPLFTRFIDNIASPLLSAFTYLANIFTSLPGPIQTLIVGFLGFLAAVGPLTLALGALIASIGVIIGPMGLGGLLTLLGSAGFAAAMSAFGTMVVTIGTFTGAALLGVAAAGAFTLGIATMIEMMSNGGDFEQAVLTTDERMRSLWDNLKSSISETLGTVKDSIQGVFSPGSETNSNVTGFGENVRGQMQQSAEVVAGLFGDIEGRSVEFEKREMERIEGIETRRRQAEENRRNFLETSQDLMETIASREITRIQTTLQYNLQAQKDHLLAERERYTALGAEGETAVNKIDEALEELEEQIKQRTFGQGVKDAVDEFVFKMTDAGAQIKSSLTAVFMSLKDVIRDFILTGELDFQTLWDAIKLQIAEFLASQIVGRLVGFFADLLSTSGSTILQKIGDFLFGTGGGSTGTGTGTGTVNNGGLTGVLTGANGQCQCCCCRGQTQGGGDTNAPGGGFSYNPGDGQGSGGSIGLPGGGSIRLPPGLASQTVNIPGIGAVSLGNLAGAASGAMLGNWGASELFGGGIGTDVGSGIGGAAGFAIGNAILPGVGGIIGATLGSFFGGGIGSLFGPGPSDFTQTGQIDPVTGNFRLLPYDPDKYDPEVFAAANQMGTYLSAIAQNIIADTGASLTEGIAFTVGKRDPFNLYDGNFRPNDFSNRVGTVPLGNYDALFGAATNLLFSNFQGDPGLLHQFRVAHNLTHEEMMALQGFDHGGADIFTTPTLIRVGERPEQVRVGPIGSQDSGGMQVNLYGPTIFDEVSTNQFARRLSQVAMRRNRRGFIS